MQTDQWADYVQWKVVMKNMTVLTLQVFVMGEKRFIWKIKTTPKVNCYDIIHETLLLVCFIYPSLANSNPNTQLTIFF
jgi:hypothetical protein